MSSWIVQFLNVLASLEKWVFDAASVVTLCEALFDLIYITFVEFIDTELLKGILGALCSLSIHLHRVVRKCVKASVLL